MVRHGGELDFAMEAGEIADETELLLEALLFWRSPGLECLDLLESLLNGRCMDEGLQKAFSNGAFAHRGDAGTEELDDGVHLELIEGVIPADQILFGDPGIGALKALDCGWHMVFCELEEEQERQFFEVGTD